MGRPQTFEEATVLRKAMDVFWAQGYEATSIDDLVEATGLARQSLYNTFGNKHQFYMLTLKTYEEYLGARMLDRLRNAPDVKEGFRRLFDQVIEDAVSEPSRRGCMMVNAATELASRDTEVRKLVSEAQATKEAIFAEAIHNGQMSGEFKSHINAEDLAKFLYNSLLGLRVRAVQSPQGSTLKPIVKIALSLLE